MTASFDRTPQDLPPLGHHAPLGYTIPPLQPPEPLGHQVQLQPLPPLGRSEKALRLEEAIAHPLPESTPAAADESATAMAPDPAAEFTTTSGTQAPEAIPTVQRQTPAATPATTPDHSDDLPESTQAIAASSTPHATAASAANLLDQSANEDINHKTKRSKHEINESATNATLISRNIDQANSSSEDGTYKNATLINRSIDQENDSSEDGIHKEISEADKTSENKTHDNLINRSVDQNNTDRTDIPGSVAEEKLTTNNVKNEDTTSEYDLDKNSARKNSASLSLKPDENANITDTTNVTNATDATDARNVSSTAERSLTPIKPDNHLELAVDSPDLSLATDDLPHLKDPLPSSADAPPEALLEQQSASPEQPTPPSIRAKSIAPDPHSLTEGQANDALTENPAQSSPENEREAIATSDEAPTVQTKRIEPTNGATDGATSGATDGFQLERVEATETSTEPIQLRLEGLPDVPLNDSLNSPSDGSSDSQMGASDETAVQDLKPLGQSKPLIQKKNIFLSRLQTEQDQRLEQDTPAAQMPPEHVDTTAVDANDPIHLLTLPEQSIPDRWATLEELVGDNTSPGTPSEPVRNSSENPAAAGQVPAQAASLGSELPSAEIPNVTLSLNSSANPAEPAEVAIPTAWSSLTELINESLAQPHSFDSTPINTQESHATAIAPKIQQSTHSEITLNEATLELLTRHVYQAIRSRLAVEQERQWGRSTHPFP